jgi:aerobic carbon-monoxide dehydrogenase large subunit
MAGHEASHRVGKDRGWSGRVEDEALLRGAGRYSDDVHAAHAAAGVFVRSPHAHARIRHIDCTAALKLPGVVAVLTAHDFGSANLASVTGAVPLPGRNGSKPIVPFRPALAGDLVVHVGQPVALVVAETAAAAQDAADQVTVDYDALPVVAGAHQAQAGVQIWPEAPGNLAFDWTAPADPSGDNRREIDRIFAGAPQGGATYVARASLVNQRIAAVSMEPRTATASHDAASDRFTLRCGTQGVAGVRGQLCGAMRLTPDRLRVLTDDVGGGFGMKASSYPEYVALLCAARQVKRPVHWVSTRSEAFVSDNQARDSFWDVELALDKRGKFLALRVTGLAGMGAFLTGVALFCPTIHISGCLPGMYNIPRMVIDTRAMFTNTVPTGPYRGAGRPEANYLLERVVDEAARISGIDAAELRRRNLIRPEAIPYVTATGSTYDSGDFPALFEKAVDAADYKGFAARRKQAAKRGKLRGIGIGCYLEISGGHLDEAATIAFPGGGKIHVGIGASSNGQGHATVFGRLVAGRLGVAPEAVTIMCGDSARDVPGFGAVASRSAMMVGSAISNTIDAMLEKARQAAALLLQAGEAELAFRDGIFEVADSARRISLFDVAERASELVRQGVIAQGLDTRGEVKTGPSFPNGCHVAEVEIDRDTGAIEIVSYVAVDDCGRVLDPVIVTGQIHGGVAQGLGQALCEATVYDPDSGQALAGSFMDYAMPRADGVPAMTVLHHEAICKTNPLGVKGTGEAGTTAAPCAIVNAIANALPRAAAAAIQMPVTSQAVWRALQGTRNGGAPQM